MSEVPSVSEDRIDAGLREAIETFRADPANQWLNTRDDLGACHWSATRFASVLAGRGLRYRVLRYRGLAGWRTEWQHVTDVGGIVVDWIGPQFRQSAAWPHLSSREAFEQEFGKPYPCCPACGEWWRENRATRRASGADRRHVCRPGSPDEQRSRDELAAVLRALPPEQLALVEAKIAALRASTPRAPSTESATLTGGNA